MGDSRRFDLFARLILSRFPPARYRRVADVAAGKGHLQMALKEKGFEEVTSFDAGWRNAKRGQHRVINVSRAKKWLNHMRRNFGPEIQEEFDLLVGMHPDEATDVVIVEAARRQVPFVICPCCVKPCALPFLRNYKYADWIAHLTRSAERLGFEVSHGVLKMNGKNDVLVGVPRR